MRHCSVCVLLCVWGRRAHCSDSCGSHCVWPCIAFPSWRTIRPHWYTYPDAGFWAKLVRTPQAQSACFLQRCLDVQNLYKELADAQSASVAIRIWRHVNSFVGIIEQTYSPSASQAAEPVGCICKIDCTRVHLISHKTFVLCAISSTHCMHLALQKRYPHCIDKVCENYTFHMLSAS